jgi:hypothetical protein
MARKLNYNDWFYGRVCPNPTYVPKGKEYTITSWNDFLKNELPKIRKKQKEIFTGIVENRFNELTILFNNDFDKSKVPLVLLKNTIKQCYDILFGVFKNNRPYQALYWDVTFSPNFYTEMRKYSKLTIERGEKADFDFIHSLRCGFYRKEDVFPIVEAESIWKFYKWLLIKNVKSNKKTSKIKLEKTIYAESSETNPYPLIFRNIKGYHIFRNLELQIDGKNKLSIYSFIYHKLCEYDFIPSDTPHKKFMAFIYDHSGFEIKYRKFTNRTTLKKEKVFSQVLKTFETN